MNDWWHLNWKDAICLFVGLAVMSNMIVLLFRFPTLKMLTITILFTWLLGSVMADVRRWLDRSSDE